MLSLHHWKDSHMKPNGVIHYDFNFFGLTLPLQKLAFVPRFSSWHTLSLPIRHVFLKPRRKCVVSLVTKNPTLTYIGHTYKPFHIDMFLPRLCFLPPRHCSTWPNHEVCSGCCSGGRPGGVGVGGALVKSFVVTHILTI